MTPREQMEDELYQSFVARNRPTLSDEKRAEVAAKLMVKLNKMGGHQSDTMHVRTSPMDDETKEAISRSLRLGREAMLSRVEIHSKWYRRLKMAFAANLAICLAIAYSLARRPEWVSVALCCPFEACIVYQFYCQRRMNRA